jgi:flagellar biogenesis protein FliO
MPVFHFRLPISALPQSSGRRASCTTRSVLTPLASCLLLIALGIAPTFPQGVDSSSAPSSESIAPDWLPSSPPRPHGSLGDPGQSSDSVQIGGDIQPVSISALLGKLALTAGLLYAGLWGWAKWRGRGIATPGGGRGGLIRVRERVSLGSAGHLYVVAFGSRSLLISAVGDKVTLLTGNSTLEMEGMDTSSLPIQHESVSFDNEVAMTEGAVAPARRASSDRADSSFREDSRRATDWEQKRDALVRALQGSIES